MTISRLIAVAFLVSAGAAHAGTIANQPAPPASFVSGWTTGNGTDILGSGVLQGHLNLIGGVAYNSGTGSDIALTDVLYGKVSGALGQVDGQTKLFFQRGIEASYLLASGHGILAATLGPGKSVVGSADGAIISDGVSKAPGMTGGGSQSGGSNNGGSNNGGSNNGGTNNGGTSNGGTQNSNTGDGGSGSQSGGSNGDQPSTVFIPEPANKPNDSGLTLPSQVTPAVAVPEPSSIALMMLGMLGAGAMRRRRTC